MDIKYPNVVILKEKEEDKTTVKVREKQLVIVGKAPPLESIKPRSQGPLAHKSFYLSDNYDWIIVNDNSNMLCLVPLRKV